MNHLANNWYFGWGWILWLGFVFLMFSSFGHWGYSYRIHRMYGLAPRKDAIHILNERYARGEVTRAQFIEMKADIAKPQS